jgi:hypothetical protein
LIIGLLAIAVARRPEGIAGQLRTWVRRTVPRLAVRKPAPPEAPAPEPDIAPDPTLVRT